VFVAWRAVNTRLPATRRTHDSNGDRFARSGWAASRYRNGKVARQAERSRSRLRSLVAPAVAGGADARSRVLTSVDAPGIRRSAFATLERGRDRDRSAESDSRSL